MQRVGRFRGLSDAKEAFLDKINLSLNRGDDYLKKLGRISEIINRLNSLNNIKEDEKLELIQIKSMLSQMREDEDFIQKFPATTQSFVCFKVDTTIMKEEILRNVRLYYPNIIARLTNSYKEAIQNTETEIDKTKKCLAVEKDDIVSYGYLVNSLNQFGKSQNNIANTLAVAKEILEDNFMKQANGKEMIAELNQAKQNFE